jgi:hypothetical protein
MRRDSAFRLVMVSSIFVVAGLILLWISTAFDGTANVVISTLGTVLIAIGAVDIVAEFAIRKSMREELADLLTIDRDVYKAGIVNFRALHEYQSKALLRGSSSVTAIVSDPNLFISHHLEPLLAHARSYRCDVEVIVVDVESDQLQSYADRVGLEVATFVSLQMKIRSTFEKNWQGAGSIRMRSSSRLIPYTFILTPIRAVIHVPELADSAHESARVLELHLDRDGQKLAPWLEANGELIVKEASAPYVSIGDKREPEGETWV